MKVGKFLEEHGPLDADACDLCALHDMFRDAHSLDIYECPKCDGEIWLENAITFPVGGHNGVDDNENIFLAPIVACTNCSATIAFIPTAIIWNANHDVYYTGGTHYLTDDFVLGKELLPTLEQYKRRIQAGEELSAELLNLWIKQAVEEAVAKFLVDKGLKIA